MHSVTFQCLTALGAILDTDHGRAARSNSLLNKEDNSTSKRRVVAMPIDYALIDNRTFDFEAVDHLWRIEMSKLLIASEVGGVIKECGFNGKKDDDNESNAMY